MATKKEPRYTVIRNVKIARNTGVTAIVQLEVELCTKQRIIMIASYLNQSFAKYKVGLNLANKLIQYQTTNIETIGEDLENNFGETVNTKRLSFLLTNGDGVSEDEFKDIVTEIFTNLVNEFENTKVDVSFLDTETIGIERK